MHIKYRVPLATQLGQQGAKVQWRHMLAASVQGAASETCPPHYHTHTPTSGFLNRLFRFHHPLWILRIVNQWAGKRTIISVTNYTDYHPPPFTYTTCYTRMLAGLWGGEKSGTGVRRLTHALPHFPHTYVGFLSTLSMSAGVVSSVRPWERLMASASTCVCFCFSKRACFITRALYEP